MRQPPFQHNLLHDSMACWKLPMKLMASMAFWISVVLFSSIKTGVCLKQAGACRPICRGNDCVTVIQDSVDFKTAEETCRGRKGELTLVQSGTDGGILDILRQELYGDFWIGLRLPAGACSNLSAPLRGYERTSVGMHGNFIASLNTWKEDVIVCSPRCVSLSNDLKWTERPCSDKTDGYLCKTDHKDACQAQELADPKIFQSPKGCSDAPCEHHCTVVKELKGGYKCSCSKGYIPDSKNPKRCQLHCAEAKCPATCDRHNPDICDCPYGFIMNEKMCEDIDECKMEQCDQDCKNTIGGFSCSCRKGFKLKNEVRCIKAVEEPFVLTTPVVTRFVKPTAKNTERSSASAGSFVWIWIFAAVAVVVLICVGRIYAVKCLKRREQRIHRETAAPGDNVECL